MVLEVAETVLWWVAVLAVVVWWVAYPAVALASELSIDLWVMFVSAVVEVGVVASVAVAIVVGVPVDSAVLST
ncbi:MAG: hypothetical protein KVP17_003734 [Porospora cf. gigantea B]|uniref:uncharacterized protein n=1 Tax=Porospora cf. gigantea B TaxID=2853592 RepID=UPI003571E945|nr:MAG: hypothetical protein KVP17_003734 [Porospora cf. gigantea B]